MNLSRLIFLMVSLVYSCSSLTSKCYCGQGQKKVLNKNQCPYKVGVWDLKRGQVILASPDFRNSDLKFFEVADNVNPRSLLLRMRLLGNLNRQLDFYKNYAGISQYEIVKPSQIEFPLSSFDNSNKEVSWINQKGETQTQKIAQKSDLDVRISKVQNNNPDNKQINLVFAENCELRQLIGVKLA